MTPSAPLPRPRRANFAGDRVPVKRLRAAGVLSPSCAQALERANRWLGHQNGGEAPTFPLRIELADDRQRPPALGDDESYRLRISSAGAVVSAATLAGVNWALATLVQLVDRDSCLPIGEIEDGPAFPWRGLMVDAARRFISLDTLLTTLDAMALHKLNVLHLHLTDDQGFRFPSAAFPRLASKPCYSAGDLRILVAEAAERSIRVVPELDMPGHVTSWLCAHPEWGPRRAPVPPTRRFGPHQAVLNPADEAVYAAIDILLGELADLFPDAFVHIGGDEVDAAWWRESEEVAGYMIEHGLADTDALQAHFIARVAELAGRRGKQVIGWDEVLDGAARKHPTEPSSTPTDARLSHDAPQPRGPQQQRRQGETPLSRSASHSPPTKNLVVQAWRGATARGRALAAGHPCILSSGYYLDLFYPADVHHAYALDAAEADLIAQEDALLEDARFRHVATAMKWTLGWRHPAQTAGCGVLLGGEACLWSELVGDELLSVRLWSRMPALADRFWANQPAPNDLAALEASLQRLAKAGVVDVLGRSQALLQAFGVSERQIPAVALLEPIKWYGRLLGEAALAARNRGTEAAARPYQADTPLNRPIDALPPESFAAKKFGDLLVQGGKPLIEECEWRLAACKEAGYLPELIAPIHALALVLQAVLDCLQKRISAPAALQQVAKGSEPQGEYLVAIAPMVRDWLVRR